MLLLFIANSVKGWYAFDVETVIWRNKKDVNKLPPKTGVYLFAQGKTILYIGKATNIRGRVRNHLQRPTFRDSIFINQVSRIGYIKTSSEIEALLLESQLIKKYQPKYNVMWRDDKNYFYVVITAEKFPRVLMTHQPSASAKFKMQNAKCKITSQKSKFIGPFVDGRALKRTLRFLRHVFPYYTQPRHPTLPCSWCHLQLCPGPNPNPKQYRKNIRAIKNILLGKSASVTKRLKKEMALASKKQHYERAAELRNQIRALENVMENARIIAWENPQEQRLNFQAYTYFLRRWGATEKELGKILGIKNRISRIEAYDISNIQGQQATGSMVVFVNGKPAKEMYRKFRIRISGRPNDTAMIKEVVARRLRHEEWNLPDVMLIDGGIAQLRAALKIKNQKSKIKNKDKRYKNIKTIALAKKHNELFIEGRKRPILLKNCPQDVANLILRLRDEAHRFSRVYHHHLRSKTLRDE